VDQEGRSSALKVLFHFNVSPSLLQWLNPRIPPDWEVVCCPEDDPERFEAHWPGTQVLWHVLRPVSERMIRANPALALIQKIGVGVNTIDVSSAAQQNVAVCNMPGVNSRAVAEMALMLMLMATRRVSSLSKALGQGIWSIPEATQERLFELGGKTVGLIGTGHVPAILGPWLSAMGAQVISHSRQPKADWPYPCCSLDELLSQSDVVSLHVPLTEQTRNLLDRKNLSKMKAGAVLINTARGELVDEQALCDALDRGQLSMAGLDVFASEPIAKDHLLLQREDVICTPHMAWLTQDMFQRAIAVAIENTRRLQSGQALLHRIAPPTGVR
jgi:phosphoglycerate dehydrogenase-like enzyme